MLASVAAAMLIGGALAFLANAVPVLEAVVNERHPAGAQLVSLDRLGDPGGDLVRARRFGVIFVEVAILIPFCLINVGEGLRQIDRELMEMGRSFTRSRVRILWRVTLPLLVPFLLSALRIAYGIAWKIALVSELLGAPARLGHLMLRAGRPPTARPSLRPASPLW